MTTFRKKTGSGVSSVEAAGSCIQPDATFQEGVTAKQNAKTNVVSKKRKNGEH